MSCPLRLASQDSAGIVSPALVADPVADSMRSTVQLIVGMFLALALGRSAGAQPVVPVDLELTHSGRNYDDICFWRDPGNVENSLAFVTAKDGPTVEVFRLATGEWLQSLGGFVHPNNCDAHGNLLVTVDDDGKKVVVHRIPDFTVLAVLTQDLVKPQGVGILRVDGQDVAYITDWATGLVHVYELATFTRVRVFPTGFMEQESVVTDELYQRVYISDGLIGRTRVFTPSGDFLTEFGAGIIDADAEGMGIYRCGTAGWLVVSDQREGTSIPTEFEVFDRRSLAHVGNFLVRNASGNYTTATDGLDIFQDTPARFPNGVFGACDECSGSGNDFDLVGWERIASALVLDVCPQGRPPTCGNGIVELTSEECDGTNDVACPGLCRIDCVCGSVAPPPRCGDGVVNQATELCDGSDATACPGMCGTDCTCADRQSVALTPVADTYIHNGTDATWDHGTATHLDSDASPIVITYLRFDLSGVTTPVGSATLTLACTDPSPDGGTVYPVPNSGWVEGTRDGASSASATGPGLKWADVDTNRDKKIDARDTSPYVPDFARAIAALGKVTAGQLKTVVVTTAFQQGPRLYTIALRSKSSDRAIYRSREWTTPSLRPLLRLEGPRCTTNAACDDANPCTDDRCDAARGCVHAANTASCGDGSACTVGDHCQFGHCTVGAPVACEDGNVCTTDTCDPVRGCEHAVNTLPCENGDLCTTGDRCQAGVCVAGEFTNCNDGTPCTDDDCEPDIGCTHFINTAPCEDGNACTTNDVCVVGYCHSGVPVSCDDANVCTADACDPASGCTHAGVEGACDDGNACTTVDVCAAGTCTGSVPPVCDDGNGCTDDACGPGSGCVSVPNTASCSDADACTAGDRCAAGACAAGGPLDCDDANPCTDDRCDAASGCGHDANTATCSDANACTAADSCAGGTCQPGTAVSCDDGSVCTTDACDPVAGCTHVAISCDDGNPCTDDLCDPVGGCTHVANTAACDDGDACTSSDTCAGTVCVGGPAPVCDDHNGCTDDACEPARGCVYTPNDALCDDGNVCTVGDRCAAGACTGGGVLPCDDGNGCTDDGCDPATGCTWVPHALDCEDGNACTIGDRCGGGVCGSGSARSCDDGNACTDDGCDPGSGCVSVANSAACDDGDACTVGDTCVLGTCHGGDPRWCDDGDACTADGCDATLGCVHMSVAETCDDASPCTDDGCDPLLGCTYTANSAPCDDGDACTTDDICAAEACVGGTAPDCDDHNPCTDDSCDPLLGCVYAANAVPCDDGSACTTADVCSDGACVGGPAPACDDGNPCTDEGCDPATGCTWTFTTSPCDDGEVCTTADTCRDGVCEGGPPPSCDDQNVCTDDGCVPGSGCVHPFNGAACDDSDACTTGETCAGGVCSAGTAVDCDDANACTADSCDPVAGCRHVPSGAACDDLDPCTDDSCDGVLGCVHSPNTAACNDGNACTVGDTCANGTCGGGPSCGDGVIQAGCGETCDGTSVGSCAAGCIAAGQPGACTCAPVPRCGDNQVNQVSEQCDGTANAACPGACRSDCTCPAPVGTVEADVYADSASITTNFGSNALLSVDAGPTARQTFVRVRVTGVGTRRVTSAKLRLQVASGLNAESVVGGRIHAITACAWGETTLTWNNKPTIDGATLATLGAVAKGQVVDFDVTTAVTGDGLYCFALESLSTDGVDYNSREGSGTRPAFVVSAQ